MSISTTMDTFMSLTNVVLEHCLAVVSSDTSLQSNELEPENTLSFHTDSEDVGNGNLRLPLGHQHYCEENQNNGIAAGSKSKNFKITKIDSLSVKILDIILSYLNPSDLIHSRFVCRHWNTQICQNSKFLSSIVLQVNEHSLPVLAGSSVSWKNISVCKIDFATTKTTVTTTRAKIKPKTRIPSPVPQQPPPSYSEATSNSNNSSTPNPVLSPSPSHISPPEDKIEIKPENGAPPPPPHLLQSPLEVEVDWSKTQHFLGHAKYLDFRCSILTWGTIQTFLSWTKVLEHLSFDRCTLLSPVSAPTPLQIKQQTPQKIGKQSNTTATEKECNDALKKLKTLTIQDIGVVDKMLQILIKIVAKKLTNLERIYVVFDSNMNNFINPGNNTSEIVSTAAVAVTTSSTTATSLEQANVFHYQILQLMFENRKSIRCLYLNLRDRILMSTFCGQVLDNFDVTISHLEEFQLTPYLAEYSDDSLDNDVEVITSAGVASVASMTSSSSQSSASSVSDGNSYNSNNNSTAPMFTLMNFLNRHPTLKHVSFPHFNSRSSNDFRRRRMFRSLPKAVEKLNLPGYSYLVPDFLSQLPKLKSIFMGSIPGKPFHPNSYRYAPHVCQFIEEVGVSTRIHLRPGKLVNFAWKFPKLTKLEFDAMRSVVNDLDLQGIILNCTCLRYLSIFGCDLITDFGVTGSSLEFCKEIFRLGVIYSHPESEIPRRSKYKPINTLKGLRTLILRGNSKITDVGIFYGLRFQELKHLWIPYSERITGWGLKQLGSWNPSLEALGVTAVNVAHSEALNDLMEKHPRISSDRILVQSWYDESPSIMSSPSMLTSLIDD